MGYWVKPQCLLPRAEVRARRAPPEPVGQRRTEGPLRGTPLPTPWRACSVLGPSLPRSDEKPQEGTGRAWPLLRGTVYLINCIFTIKCMSLRGQGAKDVGWACKEKLTPEF